MTLNSVISIAVASLAFSGLSGCKPSGQKDATIATPQNVSDEMADYASAVIDEFYDYDLDAMLARSNGKMSIEALETFADNTHETAQPANKVKQAHHYSQNNGVKRISLEYAIPNNTGQEIAIISLSYDTDTCCQLVGFTIK